MKTDIQIQKDVMDELNWEPFLNSSEIGVAVKEGIVTLSGIVDSYSKKLKAERITKKIAGVKAVAEEIQVGISPAYRKTDPEIAGAVYNALKWHSAVREDEIKIKVEDGVVTLDGEVEWEYQRNNAKNAVEHLTGVRAVINLIKVSPRITPVELERKISAAFQRSASIDSGKITVSIMGNKVILTGKVRSIAESEDAENVVWAAPGVYSVENKLDIEEPEYAF
ncbi:BON domain-containing protein [Mucilaginibacter xinganensis]|uniref:Osmotically-inducible protein OsmY, contains BON domain n=1 Tax=Mucilaginibacter xinganensis TaxID=1234841 RepID=A0A223NUN1_9SPHI|nr:BON domain-containing protein [Mucilaginibacter xinganensis]ASU33595.1 Osmotically-inducible protein OsmY, contains BON domain [Mucilaginibacter xinganensis]